MRDQLEFSLFGSPEVRLKGQLLSGFRSSKTQALLFYLAVTGRPHARPSLAGLLWGDQPEAATRVSLNKCLSNLNELVGDAVVIERQSVAFNREYPYLLDTERLDAIFGISPTPETISTLQSALALYRGDFLEGFYVRGAPDFEQWQLLQRAHYRETVVNGLYALANARDQQGDLPGAIVHTRRLLTLEPWREDAHRHLMILLARSGQRAVALAQYESCRRILQEELAVEPDAETLATAESIRLGTFEQVTKGQGDKRQQQNEVEPAITTWDAPRGNLPQPLTHFVGRKEETAQLTNQIIDPSCRLTTLIGPGGIGKTRLAIEVARLLQTTPPNFVDGIYFISMAEHDSPMQLGYAIAKALALIIDPGQELLSQLQGFLHDKQLLLLLDNFEHRLDAAEQVAQLLLAAPQLRVLVTSRQRLQVEGEKPFVVCGLDFENSDLVIKDEELSAVQLFLQSARHNLLEVALSAGDFRHILTICRQVEGMPLGIELAASWVGLLTPAEISLELQQSLDILTREQRSGKLEHNNLRAVFESTWQRLDGVEQKVFARLASFRASFTREAAEQVAGASPRMLITLANKSLIQQELGSRRYRLHALLRQFAEEKLTQQGVAQTYDRLSAYYGDFLRRQQPRLRGPDFRAAMEEIDAEIENVRTGWQWAVANHQLDVVEDSIWPLKYFFDRRLRLEEGYNCFVHTVDTFEMEAPLGRRGIVLAKLIAAKGHILWIKADFIGLEKGSESPDDLFQRSIQIFESLGVKEECATPFRYWGIFLRWTGKLEQAIQYTHKALAIYAMYEEQCDHWNLRWAFYELAYCHLIKGTYEESIQYFRRMIAICQADGDINVYGRALFWLAQALRMSGQLEEARATAHKAIEVNTATGNKVDIAQTYQNLAYIDLKVGDYPSAREYAEAALSLFREIGHNLSVDEALTILGLVACKVGDYEKARYHFLSVLENCFKANLLETSWDVPDAALEMATLLSREGTQGAALELVEFVVRHPLVWEASKNRARALRQQLLADGALPLSPPLRSIHDIVAELLDKV